MGLDIQNTVINFWIPLNSGEFLVQLRDQACWFVKDSTAWIYRSWLRVFILTNTNNGLKNQPIFVVPHPGPTQFFFPWRCDPTRVMASSFTRFSRSHTTTRHSGQDSSGRVISSSQRPLPDNTQHSQQTNFHAPGGNRTHDLSRRAAADLRLRPHGHWDRLIGSLTSTYLLKYTLAACFGYVKLSLGSVQYIRTQITTG